MELIKCELTGPVRSSYSNQGSRHTATYYAETSKTTMSDHVTAMCQGLLEGPPHNIPFPGGSGNSKIPPFGLHLTTDQGVPETVSRDKSWVEASDDRWGDFATFLTNADAGPSEPNCHTKWLIQCNWTQPTPEANTVNTHRGPAQSQLNQNPISWTWRFRVGEGTTTSSQSMGYKVVGGTPEQVLSQMQNTLNDPLPPVDVSWTTTQLVGQINTTDPFYATRLAQLYQNTVNDRIWTVNWNDPDTGAPYFITAAPFSARFIRATMSDRRYWREIPYYECTVRVEYGREPYFTRRTNEGYRARHFITFPYGTVERILSTNGHGVPYGAPVALDANGEELPSGQQPLYIDYLLQDQTDYEGLFEVNPS